MSAPFVVSAQRPSRCRRIPPQQPKETIQGESLSQALSDIVRLRARLIRLQQHRFNPTRRTTLDVLATPTARPVAA